jgi:hypothetical protein
VSIVADHEPRLPDRWTPLPEADQALLALTGPRSPTRWRATPSRA